MTNVSEKVQTVLAPKVAELGYELVETIYEKKFNGMNLTLYIDSPNGIKIEDCELVHNAVDSMLDEINPTNDKPYTLNVSSLGLDRPLKTDRDFKRNLGEDIEINLYSKLDGKKIYEGKLIGFCDESVTIKDKNEITINKKLISKITKKIIF